MRHLNTLEYKKSIKKEVILKPESETMSTCCPEFDPAQWNDKIFEWDNKKFIKDYVCTILYIPINFGKVMKRLNKKVTEADVKISDWLCLSEQISRWNMGVYLAVDKEIPDAENITLSGKYYCKTYEGHFKDTGKWCNDYVNIAKSKGFKIIKMFMWYTTCPKCAKKYGKNYVAIISQIK
jgi:hypothetical protein